MSRSRYTLLRENQIPATLWRRAVTAGGQNEELLVLPPTLVKAYRGLLDELGLRQAAESQEPNDEGPQGGKTIEAAYGHFARNFSGSCARVQLVGLDPKGTFRTTREAVVRLFSGGELCLLDLPCGAGAASATLLGLVAELRDQALLPRHPLRVMVLGGDISEPARTLKKRLFARLRPRLRECGIDVRVAVQNWDIEDEDQTAELIAAWMQRRQANARTGLLAVNFSAFLHNKVKQCAGALREILRFARIHDATVFWIEPRTNAALTGFFPALSKHVLSKVSRLRVPWAGNGAPRQMQCRVIHPVQRGGRFTARAAALHLEPVKEVDT
jgi:hypothetical protein